MLAYSKAIQINDVALWLEMKAATADNIIKQTMKWHTEHSTVSEHRHLNS